MHETQRTRADSFLLLGVGLTAGFLIAAVVFLFVYRGSTPSDSQAQVSASAPADGDSTPAPAPGAQSWQETRPSGAFEPQTVPATTPTQVPYGQTPVVSSDVMQQVPAVVMQSDAGATDNGSSAAVTMHSSGAGGNYTFVNPVYSGNPSWTVGRNGLIENPAVDPPSSRGRAYSY